MKRSFSSVRAGFSAAALLAAVSACSDGGAPVTGPQLPSPTPANTLATVDCTADVHAGRVQCGDATPGTQLRADRIIGGQHVNVTLTSTNVSYDSTTEIMGADLTVQNLLLQRMGSDGTTVSGVRIFFASGPNVTSGTGAVTLDNADGLGTFTGTNQPYYQYDGALAPGATSAVKRWRFVVPKSVGTFDFRLYVSTPVVPVIVFEMWPGGNRDIYRMGIDGNDLVKLSTSLMTDATATVAAGKVVFTSYRDGNAELYSVPVAGGTETRLTTTTTLSETLPSLSPDGTKLAWVSGPSGGITKIRTGKADATGSAQAVPGWADAIENSPTWRSNTELSFSMASGSSSDIYGIVVGDTARLQAGGSNAEVEPAWSADGKTLAFASNRTGDTELFLRDGTSGVVTQLTHRTGSDGAPTWLSDGRIVFTCTQGVHFHLCLIDPANPATITTIPTPNEAEHAAAVRF